MLPVKVYIDANVFKFSATSLPRLRPRKEKVDWGGKDVEVILHDFVVVNPNESISNPELSREAALLQPLAELGKQGAVHYVVNGETVLESWGLPNTDSQTGRFYRAPITKVSAPVEYSRTTFGSGTDPADVQFRFLSSLTDKRFLELQKMTGAYQGTRGLVRNQLLDAFHVWCAEYHKCDFFLTLDFKLVRMLRNSKKKAQVSVVRPSELLAYLTADKAHAASTGSTKVWP